jgi:hypothetical protein
MQFGHHSYFLSGISARQLGYGKSHFSAALTELAPNEAHIISIQINARNGIFDCIVSFVHRAAVNRARKRAALLTDDVGNSVQRAHELLIDACRAITAVCCAPDPSGCARLPRRSRSFHCK